MTRRLMTVVFLASVCVAATAGSSEAQCLPDGDVPFICGPVSPEDLVPVPDTPWVLAAGMEDDGYLYAIDARDRQSTVLFPSSTYHAKPDAAFSGCGGDPGCAKGLRKTRDSGPGQGKPFREANTEQVQQ